MCFYADGEGVLLDERIVRARKPRRCIECPGTNTIQLGDSYRKYVGIYEGDFFEVAFCARCDFIRHAIHWYEKEVEGCDEYESWPLMFGVLDEDWRNGDYAEKLGVPEIKYIEDFPRW